MCRAGFLAARKPNLTSAHTNQVAVHIHVRIHITYVVKALKEVDGSFHYIGKYD